MVLSVSIKTTKAQAQAVDIGTVEQVSGYARIERDKGYDVITDFGIQSYDKAQTEAGRMGIRFIDDTSIRITEHSMVVIDEFVFDPNPDNSKLALNFVKGTARFTSSLTNKISKKNIKLTTNSAVVGIRGTDFTITVEPDTGKSLFILLPDKDGNPSGEISVTTAMGTVILNKPYQATTTRVFEAPPSNPVILDLSLDFINNNKDLSSFKDHFDKKQIKQSGLLTLKPKIFVCNVDEKSVQSGNNYTKSFIDKFGKENTIVVSADIENQINELELDEKKN